jgi:hypothetical protein
VIELNDVDGPLQDICHMAEIAAELTSRLDSNDARPGFFEPIAPGRQPACIRLQRYVEAD